MPVRALLVTILFATACALGCRSKNLPDTSHQDFTDAVFGRRHTKNIPEKLPYNSLLAFAKEVTRLEDAIRRDGSITSKQPDVWGDGTLTHDIQEYDALLAKSVQDFGPTIQAYIARSDQAEVQSATSLAAAVGEGDTAVPTVDASTALIDIKGEEAFKLIGSATAAAKPTASGIGVEPTELERQRSTFINVNQALRRRNTGSDTARAPGYALYKFRVPVSVIPGRETSRGYSAIVTFRAQSRVDEAHLRYAFPKLVIGDLVDELSPLLRQNWKSGFEQQGTEAQSIPLAVFSPRKVFGNDSLIALHNIATANLGSKSVPKDLELRTFLVSYFGQVHNTLEARGAYATETSIANNDVRIVETSDGAEVLPTPSASTNLIEAAARNLVLGQELKELRGDWVKKLGNPHDPNFAHTSWMIAVQSGVLDHNLKKILKELKLKGSLSAEDEVLGQVVQFYNPVTPEAVRLWETIIREEFPIHVFALDPDVEEQNVYDAFSRRREMQLALAIGVAERRFGFNQRLAASRQLALDMASIDLNRVSVGFTHGNDTFGWYFRPRVQSPPTETSNLAAFARTVWSTGPTEHYDMKHRELEPGIRECEVLVVMPSFVTQVNFDVTTNWEKLAHPGVTKRSYEEMVALGGEVHRLKARLMEVSDLHCFRPGDYARLLSRVEQLERMLGMQTFQVDVPYEYELAGTELFNTGDVHLRPVLTGFYGLEYAEPDGADAHVFLTGRHFHPTLTHVIVGGSESDALANPQVDVEVISRELLQVKIKKLNPKLSTPGSFVVRVATPSGLSGPLRIGVQSTPAQPKKGLSIRESTTSWKGTLNAQREFDYVAHPELPKEFTITNKTGRPLPPTKQGKVVARLTAKDKDGEAISFDNNTPNGAAHLDTTPLDMVSDNRKLTIPVSGADSLSELIKAALNKNPLNGKDGFDISVTIFAKFDEWPVETLMQTISIKVKYVASPAVKSANLERLQPPG